VFSIDIAITAVLGNLAVNKAFQIYTDYRQSLLLFLAVLLVYWFDHIIDIKKYGSSISSRHQQFAKKSKIIYALGVLILLFSILFSFEMLSLQALIYGSILGIFCFLYLFFNRYKWLNKELIAASIYSAGIYFQVLMNTNLLGLISGFLFFGITYFTMMGIAKVEFKSDSYYGIPNNFNLNWLQIHLFEILILVAVYLLMLSNNTSVFTLILSYVLLLLSLKFLFDTFNKHHFLKDNYRIVIEWLFLLPWIFA
jgi:hypothetical protein